MPHVDELFPPAVIGHPLDILIETNLVRSAALGFELATAYREAFLRALAAIASDDADHRRLEEKYHRALDYSRQMRAELNARKAVA